MKLWLLDADVIIKFFEIDVFDKLVAHHDIFTSSTVIDEVKYYYRFGQKFNVNFRKQYIETNQVKEVVATIDEMAEVVNRLPAIKRNSIHAGELESLSVLIRESSLSLCTFDAAAIKILPFLDVTERAFSAEKLMSDSGLTLSPKHKLDPKLTEAYFRTNLDQGKRDYLLYRE